MNRVSLILLIMIFIPSVMIAQSGGKSRYVKPSNYQKRVTTVVSGKQRDYYSLSSASPSVITVQGPGKLAVKTRGRFAPGAADKLNYEIMYTVDGGQKKSVPVSAVERAKDATYLKGTLGVPGQLKGFSVELSRGSHTLEFRLKDTTIHVAARYHFIPTKEKKQDWIAYSPMPPAEPVDLIAKEATTSYYRFSGSKPLKVEIIGPTELRVMTRIENHYGMKGRINYRVQVKEMDKVISTYQLSSVRSETAVYKENKSLVPGKACEFEIIVPKGKHVYTILPLDEDKSTILGRLLLPKKDVKLEN